MERRYYLLKIAVVLLAVVTVTVTSGMGSTRMAHEVNLARYSAPAQHRSRRLAHHRLYRARRGLVPRHRFYDTALRLTPAGGGIQSGTKKSGIRSFDGSTR